VQYLLSGTYWVCSLHLDLVEQRDLSVFRGSAWCSRPDLIPTSADLLIPDPTLAEAESPLVKRGLIYPIELTLLAGLEAGEGSFSATLRGLDHG
jgi:hypothetical protein